MPRLCWNGLYSIRERVHPLDIPFTQALKSVSRWGSGSKELVAAMETEIARKWQRSIFMRAVGGRGLLRDIDSPFSRSSTSLSIVFKESCFAGR